MLFTEEHESLRRTASQFIEAEINPYCDQWEQDGIFPAREVLSKMGKLGLLGIPRPVEYGGAGLDYSYQIVLSEEMGRIKSPGVSMGIGVQIDMATPALAKHGSHYLKDTYLRKAISGEAVFCLGVSEANSGSDVASIKTKALKDGNDYIISGSKMWITNSTQSDYICLLVNTEGDNPHTNKSLIVVPSDSPGISFSAPLNKLGMRASDTAQIFFDNVRVPQKNLIGEEGKGFVYQMQQFNEERLFCASTNLKLMENCIQETINYTRQRKAFNKSILQNQVVHFRLAELQTEIELLRALVYQSVEEYIHGSDVTAKAAMAKLKTGRLVREVTDACLQYWGGMGFMWDNPVSSAYRDTRLVSIGGGADEVMLSIICKTMGTLSK